MRQSFHKRDQINKINGADADPLKDIIKALLVVLHTFLNSDLGKVAERKRWLQHNDSHLCKQTVNVSASSSKSKCTKPL